MKGVFVQLMRAMDAESDSRERRLTMVQRQIADRGVRDPLVLAALRDVPRENFLPADLREFAYDDAPLPIGQGQTISQPYIVALMAEALQLRGGERVLEVGTGSGYAAAVIAQIAAEVYTVERCVELAARAAEVLAAQGCTNVHVLRADGTLGWPEHAPFDAIAVAAGGPEIPESLKTQLKIGGRLVIPVGQDRHLQELLRITRTSDERYRIEELADVRFVPLIGEGGWDLQ
ncbi:MAG TPA: protein-L-isoaspartate(D-aspartate) O-methyltransferase [Steroidobacteraceae bacterium]|nr:protein-L-isoaspartate(D-aspartate) O-methyltransferase [Steroidobacteraceae bacterium]